MEKAKLKSLMINPQKLQTVANYAKSKGVSRQTVYLHINQGVLVARKIDGVTFIEK